MIVWCNSCTPYASSNRERKGESKEFFPYLNVIDTIIQKDSIQISTRNSVFFIWTSNPAIKYLAEISGKGRVHISAEVVYQPFDTVFFIPVDTVQKLLAIIEADSFYYLPDVIESSLDHALSQVLTVTNGCRRKSVIDWDARLRYMRKSIENAIHIPAMFGDPIDHIRVPDEEVQKQIEELSDHRRERWDKYVSEYEFVGLPYPGYHILTEHEIDSLRATPNPPQWRYR